MKQSIDKRAKGAPKVAELRFEVGLPLALSGAVSMPKQEPTQICPMSTRIRRRCMSHGAALDGSTQCLLAGRRISSEARDFRAASELFGIVGACSIRSPRVIQPRRVGLVERDLVREIGFGWQDPKRRYCRTETS